ncbi:hypothetical protein ACLIKE_09775 [Ferroplasma acidiphilum]|uniref:Uncharacterized protein n=1 Tax=Ferroplasma acidiphilum TaxID=74969 RepID=A0A7K4FPU5_9ARCH|nr:hypothetical protein [Ferroplasma acidiphilum]NOL61056.1 hypothetical protein [Ferroplasma acidiphilum]WMT53695.1 MAG: hypothetical protein RE473_02325 [Ferroplasma acidiphilum]
MNARANPIIIAKIKLPKIKLVVVFPGKYDHKVEYPILANINAMSTENIIDFLVDGSGKYLLYNKNSIKVNNAQ